MDRNCPARFRRMVPKSNYWPARQFSSPLLWRRVNGDQRVSVGTAAAVIEIETVATKEFRRTNMLEFRRIVCLLSLLIYNYVLQGITGLVTRRNTVVYSRFTIVWLDRGVFSHKTHHLDCYWACGHPFTRIDGFWLKILLISATARPTVKPVSLSYQYVTI